MLDALVTSKTRKKIILKFFLNSSANAYLRHLEQELNESPNALRIELNKFEKAKLLNTFIDGNKKFYQANTKHPLFPEIRNILLKTIGFDQIIANVIHPKIGNVEQIYITGKYAKGLHSNIIDLLFVGDPLYSNKLIKLLAKVETAINKKLRFLAIKPEELNEFLSPNMQEVILLWENNEEFKTY